MLNLSLRKLAPVAAACLVAALGGAALPAQGEVVDRIVAQVNDEIITMSELDAAVKAYATQTEAGRRITDQQALQRQVLEALIDRRLAKSEAKRLEVKVSDQEVDKAIEEFKKKNNIPDDATLNKALTREGLTMKEFRQQLTEHLQQERLIQMTVGGAGAVSEAEIKSHYEQHFKETGGQQVRLRVVLIPYPANATAAQKTEVEQAAKKVLEDLRKGANFDDLMRRHSASSMDLGFIPVEDVHPNLRTLLEKLRPGEVAPVQDETGFQLIQLKEVRAGKPVPYEEARAKIQQILMGQEVEKKLGRWIKGLREKAHIKIML